MCVDIQHRPRCPAFPKRCSRAVLRKNRQVQDDHLSPGPFPFPTPFPSSAHPPFSEAGTIGGTIGSVGDSPGGGDSLFEVVTPLGFLVRAHRSHWGTIVSMKHPVMAGRESDVRNALENPDEIRESRIDPSVCLFSKLERPKRWICAVVRRSDREGVLITAYPTDAIKEGRRVWPK